MQEKSYIFDLVAVAIMHLVLLKNKSSPNQGQNTVGTPKI